jgi:type III secretory pathway component EscT
MEPYLLALLRPVLAVLVVLWATSAVPQIAAIAVASAVALFVAPVALSSAAQHTFDVQHGMAQGALAELIRGAGLGLAAAAPWWAAATAGRWAGLSWRSDSRAPPVSLLYGAMMGVAFVAVDGPLLVCAAIARSYAIASVGAPVRAADLDLAALAAWLGVAVRLALPLALATAVAELSVAAATRAAAGVSVAWPTAVIAPTLVLLVTAPMLPLLVAAFAELIRTGGSG